MINIKTFKFEDYKYIPRYIELQIYMFQVVTLFYPIEAIITGLEIILRRDLIIMHTQRSTSLQNHSYLQNLDKLIYSGFEGTLESFRYK